MSKWNLYVLRYAHTGNYYVGTTPNFKERMLIHWRRTSTKNNLPCWSRENISRKGFIYYWFSVDKNGVSQANAEHCENALAEKIVDIIKNSKSIREPHVGNGKFIDGKKEKFPVEVPTNLSIDLIDTEIKKILGASIPFELETKNNKCFDVKCNRIGSVGEYEPSKCNKSWRDVEIVGFPGDNIFV